MGMTNLDPSDVIGAHEQALAAESSEEARRLNDDELEGEEGEGEEGGDERDPFRSDPEADGDALASAGLGTDEDYGCFGGDDD
jgi:hypothetical protein